ncbi:hypothetical protein ASPSYDRAFT_63074 [Aspergillus sydowii CBS 593.65]|uniref:Aminoglycoside phosphotransferase domain-containing protein n=1 Tax=Aspergillus sydowii CBS 593.65 TaxID=1036612 RepID=A0A1L9SXR5_9EURO|nr:uncharacterized protein ASPSYDRAFT_63074 [Aspergillus sydowii CBS 593.65]OJJ51949.1 hypothetical protein ASPSYDRAFT_63074 [Aspergillus sydowii CBS 593.65]
MFRKVPLSLFARYSRFRLHGAQQARNITESAHHYNEQLRLTERYLEFDVPALRNAVAASCNRSSSDIVSFFKLSEGGFNRVFQATLSDGKNVIARIPYPSTGPEHYTVASEVATLDYLRLHGITTPKRSRFFIGPIAHYSWWDEQRAALETDRGPSKTHAKPRLPYERLYREIHGFCEVSPDSHIKNLSDYLILSRCLGFKTGSSLDRPVIRHPDFQPNNILVSESNEIVGFIDWQHSTILPLGIAAGIPKHFQNYGDPVSEKLIELQFDLPPNYDTLDRSEQISVRETIRKRLVHFLYAAFTKRLNEEHYDAIFDQSVMLHQRLFKSANTPWEGDSITLRAEMIRAIQSWRNLIAEDSREYDKRTCAIPPLEYPDIIIHDTLRIDAQQKEADTDGTNATCCEGKAREMKAKMLEAAVTHSDVTGVQSHFPFDDFHEDS